MTNEPDRLQALLERAFTRVDPPPPDGETRLPYARPNLERLGTVEELTENGSTSTGDSYDYSGGGG
jgi:hypothetical protein